MSRAVVILGAGPGGLTAARSLRRYLPPEVAVTVIDRADEQRLGISLLLIMRGWRNPAEVSLRPAQVLRDGISFLHAEVTGIDPIARRVHTDRGELPYDALLVALGAEVVPEAIPGLEETIAAGAAGQFYTLGGALHLRERLACFAGGRILIVIARLPYKCPPAPYEGALLIADRVRERGVSDSVQIDLFTPEPQPLAVAGPAVGQQLADLLAERGITLHVGRELIAVDAAHREAVFASGAREPFDLLVVIPPHQPPAVVRAADLVGEAGWVPVDLPTMRAPVDGVWAVGDVTALRLPNGLPMPKAAVFAQQQAEAAARDIARALGATAPEPEISGRGRCWFITGAGEAGYVEGDFLAEPAPVVRLYPPAPEHFRVMEQELAAWSAQGSG
jgi:sulfide:quinone oxidoreductase